MMRLAVVVPVFNEGNAIESTLARMQALRARGTRVIVVDGGSDDATVALAKPLADRVLQSSRGRAQQMNDGAEAAIESGADVLLFLHADSALPDAADGLIETALRTSGRVWGRFDVRIDAEAAHVESRLDNDELALALDRYLHRRPGNLRHAASVRATGWLCADCFNGRHRVFEASQVAFVAGCHQGACDYLGTTLATAWHWTHDRADVALPPGVLFRRRSAMAGTTLPRCSLNRRVAARARCNEAVAARRRRAGARARAA